MSIRPEFLCGLEIDCFVPEYNVGFEFQGEQHYAIVADFAMSEKDFIKRIIYDIQKGILCKRNGVLLIKVNSVSLKTNLFLRMIDSGLGRFYGLSPVKKVGQSQTPIYFDMRENNLENIKYLSNEHGRLVKRLYKSVIVEKRCSQPILDGEVREYKSKLEGLGCYYSILQQTQIRERFNRIFFKINQRKKTGEVIDDSVGEYLKDGVTLSEIVEEGMGMFF